MGLNDVTDKVCEKHQIKEYQPECGKCHGDGEVEWDDDICSIQEMTTCWQCNGSGLSPWTCCEFCEEEFMDRQMNY